MHVRIYRAVGILLVSGLFVTGMLTSSIGEPHEEDDIPKRTTAKATFAGGCFWCMEPPFDETKGVVATTSGYIGGPEKNPTYKQVATGKTGHAEAVQVVYDPSLVSYTQLLEVFWRNIDPTVDDRQFCDWGKQYRTGIFYHNDVQREHAKASKDAIIAAGKVKPVLTEITQAGTFYKAEEYHQDFYKKNPAHYKEYRFNCGRDQRLRQLWGETAAAAQ